MIARKASSAQIASNVSFSSNVLLGFADQPEKNRVEKSREEYTDVF